MGETLSESHRRMAGNLEDKGPNDTVLLINEALIRIFTQTGDAVRTTLGDILITNGRKNTIIRLYGSDGEQVNERRLARNSADSLNLKFKADSDLKLEKRGKEITVSFRAPEAPKEALSQTSITVDLQTEESWIHLNLSEGISCQTATC
jgi:hypothetical protein